AVAAALPSGPDRNSARPTLQNRRPHSSDRSLHPRSPRHRLAISSSVSPCRAGCEHHLIVSLCFRIHSARCFWRSLVQKVALSPLRVSRSVPAHLVRFPDTQSTSKSCADSRTLSSHELSRLGRRQNQGTTSCDRNHAFTAFNHVESLVVTNLPLLADGCYHFSSL